MHRKILTLRYIEIRIRTKTTHIYKQMTYTPYFPDKLQSTILLPSSKSISNRALLLCAMSGKNAEVKRMSKCDDTAVMWKNLTQRPFAADIMAAGTAMRFLTAYFAICPNEEHIVTGTQRMRERPIGVLVDALRDLGADISYVENEGFPPLHIKGTQLSGGNLKLPANVSSQYISALLMIAPLMKKGLKLELLGEIISLPYINMTISMMKQFGAKVSWISENAIRVEPKAYNKDLCYTIESDWSAASYWYEIVALSPDKDAQISLPWLNQESLQGDSAIQTYFEPLGVTTTFDAENSCAIIQKNSKRRINKNKVYEINLVNQPDLAQTLVVTCAALQQPFRFTGLRSLRIKETDRMAALQNELAKFGIALGIEGDECLFITQYPDKGIHYNGTPIATYHDHRMAMAFAPMALVCDNKLEIDNPEVVSKSYPNYWKDIEQL